MHVEHQLADLVAAISDGEKSFSPRGGPGERPSLMPEQLAEEQLERERASSGSRGSADVIRDDTAPDRIGVTALGLGAGCDGT